MFPTLLTLGPIVIRSLNVLLAIALVVGMFTFWRKGKEEHYDEMDLFDGLFLGQLLGIVCARITFIILHFDRFGLDPIAWVDIFSNPGFTLVAFFIVSGFYLYRFALKKKWDAFEILDFWVLAVAVSQVFVWLGYFLEGIFFGTPTQLPWGMIFPGVFEKHHPIQVYQLLFYLLLAWYLGWVEYRYRTFEWYRKGKNTAQTGFLLSIFLITNGLVHLLFSFITVPSLVVYGVPVDVVLAGLIFVGVLAMLYIRSGRQFFSFKRSARAKKLQQFMEE
jgi:prolipoprotein diacylglyceryltransferase